jgi:hypothetical protein
MCVTDNSSFLGSAGDISSAITFFTDTDNSSYGNPSSFVTQTSFVGWSSKKCKKNIKYFDTKNCNLKYVNRFMKLKFCSYLFDEKIYEGEKGKKEK